MLEGALDNNPDKNKSYLNAIAVKIVETRCYKFEEYNNLESNILEMINRIKDNLEIVSRTNQYKSIAQTTQMLAHDVRKPFTLINAMIDMIRDSSSSKDTTAVLKSIIPDIESALTSPWREIRKPCPA